MYIIKVKNIQLNLNLIIFFNNYSRNKDSCDIYVLTGDMNIDLLSKIDYNEKYKDTTEYLAFVFHINDVTRPDGLTCHDHFFVRGDARFHETIESLIF